MLSKGMMYNNSVYLLGFNQRNRTTSQIVSVKLLFLSSTSPQSRHLRREDTEELEKVRILQTLQG